MGNIITINAFKKGTGRHPYHVTDLVKTSVIHDGLVGLYVQRATTALMIQENWDASVRTDVVNLLKKLVPRGIWLHEQQDRNIDSHLEEGFIASSETIPAIADQPDLSLQI